MKQKEPATKKQKYLAIFLAATMFLSVAVIFFQTTDSDDKVSTPAVENDISTIPFSKILGKHVHHQFDSIADGLNMSPDGVIGAEFVNLQRTTGTPLEGSFGNTTMIKHFYGADVTKIYRAYYSDGNGFELHAIPEQKILNNSFTPVPYHGYELLARGNGTYDIWNVVGSPVIFGSRQNVKSVINVLEGNETSTTEFNQILSQTNPEDVILQEVIAKTNNITDIPADKYYKDLRKLDDGNYSQTNVFLNPEPKLAQNIAALQANSRERGVVCNVTTSGNITRVETSSDFATLLNETKSLS